MIFAVAGLVVCITFLVWCAIPNYSAEIYQEVR